jgi:hypothetical protein
MVRLASQMIARFKCTRIKGSVICGRVPTKIQPIRLKVDYEL